MKLLTLLTGLTLVVSTSANAHKLIEPGLREGVAGGVFSVSVPTTMNRLQQKEGKFQEIWTVDGDGLNKIIFFGGVPDGEALLRQRDKKNNPLPRFNSKMLLAEIPAYLETSYRSYYGSPKVNIGEMSPVQFLNQKGIRFDYKYMSVEDEVVRSGMGYATVKEQKLYMIIFEAPEIFFYGRDIGVFEKIASSLRLL